MTDPRPGGEYMPQLDGLRALAASAVVVEHFILPLQLQPFSIAKAGVWLFFVLSGYLITGILARARDEVGGSAAGRRRVWASFYVRRVLRLWPLYYATLFGVVLLGLPGARAIFPWGLAHLTNAGIFHEIVAKNRVNLALPHFWSLAVEEQFYLVWPVFVLFAPRRWLLPAAACSVLLAPVSRVVLILLTKSALAAECVPTSCLDGLGLGAVLALTEGSPSPRRRAALRLGLGLGVAAWLASLAGHLSGHHGNSMVTVERFSYALMSAWVVSRASAGFTGLAGRFLTLPPLNYLGRISYGIYVLHFPVEQTLVLLQRATGLPVHGPTGSDVLSCLYLYAVTIACASASWYLLERPMNGLKRFFPYPRLPRPSPIPPEPLASAARTDPVAR
jgi:peptidoglycan/LPS O-acetylase OafA/YrhL